MINKIRISNFKGVSSEMELSFEANPKRKADKQGVILIGGKEILLSVSLLGKNASGKTSFVEGIKYFLKLMYGELFETTREKLLNKMITNVKNENVNVNIERNEILKYINKNDFNNREKPMKFYIEFTSIKSFISVDITFWSNGDIKEIIKQNDVIFSENISDIFKFSSSIQDERLGLKKVILANGPSWIIEFVDKSGDWDKLFRNKYINRELVLRWIRIADDKIVNIIWTSKNEIEGYTLISEGAEKIISPFELSSGTKKWVSIVEIVLEAMFINQSFVCIDEINKSLHPTLSKFIIAFFNNLKINKKRSQLLFTTHSPLIVDRPFRKDAINYIDPVKGILNLGTLGMREDLSITKNFLGERLGSHPSKSDMFDLIEEFDE